MALDLANAELAAGTERAVAKPKIDLKAEMQKMANTKGGGAYIPPHRLRAMMADAELEDNEGTEYQRLSWEALRKSINGLINKVNISNIKLLVPEVRSLLRHPRLPRQLTRSLPALRREPHPRTRSLRSLPHASTGLLPPLHPHLRRPHRHRQHKTANDRRAPHHAPHRPVPPLLQTQRQGLSLLLAVGCPPELTRSPRSRP